MDEILVNICVGAFCIFLGMVIGGWASWKDAKRYFSKYPEELDGLAKYQVRQ